MALLAVFTRWQPPWIGDDPTSLWQFVLYAPLVSAFTTAALLASAHLPLYVAIGVDRRSFTLAAALGGTPAMVANAGVSALGFAMERALVFPPGIEPSLADVHLFTTTDQYGLVVTEMLIALPAAWATGWLIAVGYYRLGWLWGTVALPATFAPTWLVTAAIATSRVPGTDLVLGTGTRIMTALIALVLSGVVIDRATRDLELRGTTTWLITG